MRSPEATALPRIPPKSKASTMRDRAAEFCASKGQMGCICRWLMVFARREVERGAETTTEGEGTMSKHSHRWRRIKRGEQTP